MNGFLYGNFGQAFRDGQDQGFKRAQRSRLADLAQQAYSAAPEQRQQIVAGMVGIDPAAAEAQQKTFDAQDKRMRDEVITRARFLTSVPEQMRPQLWAKMRGDLAGFGLTDLPEQYGPEVAQAASALASAYGGGQVGEQFTLSPGSKRFDAGGQLVAEAPFAPANAQYVDVPDGMGGTRKMLLDPRTQQFTQPQFPGQQGVAPTRNDMEADIALANEMVRVGIPTEQVDAFLASRGQRAEQPGAMPAGQMGYTPPKAESEETFSNPQPVTAPDGTVRMVQFGNRGGQREVAGFAPPPTARDAKPPTDGEKNAAGYYSRMQAAGQELDALTAAGYDPGNMRDHYTAGQGPFLNWAASDQGQHYRQQQEDWVRAKLRKESGAVIGDEEMEREIRTYFPQPGDKPDVLDAKKRSRQIAEAAMKKAGGRAIEWNNEPQQQAAPPAAPSSNGWSIRAID